jgi:hypothetical protein
VFLLKVMEREHAARAAERAVRRALDETEAGAVFRAMKSALEAELRPVLLVLLRLLERRRGRPASEGTRRNGREPAVAPSEWIVDLIRRLDDDGQTPFTQEDVATETDRLRPNLRQRMARVRDALRREPHKCQLSHG